MEDIPGGTANDVYWDHDGSGRPLSAKFVSDAGSGIVYGYGPGKRLTSETTFGRTVTFDYDVAGNRTKVTWPSDGNWIYSNFDNLNRVTKVCENGTSGCPSGLLITYTLDPSASFDSVICLSVHFMFQSTPPGEVAAARRTVILSAPCQLVARRGT